MRTGIYCRTSRFDEFSTSIEQQTNIGVNFCKFNNFEFTIYGDNGISGFKISDDDSDPFNNRPDFMRLINDIKTGGINRVWVYEHSRLSRNEYASAIIFNIFEKYDIELYEKNKKLDLNDPQFQMLRKILDAVSQYERHLIINRTTRGLHNAINKGTRGFSCFYGYEKNGLKPDGRKNWKPIQSQLDLIKLFYVEIIKGNTYKHTLYMLYDSQIITRAEFNSLSRQKFRILNHFEYTGYTFTHEGRKIYDKIICGEIQNVHLLNVEKYYVKCVPYPVQLISINDWFTIFEKNIIRLHNIKERKKTFYKSASTGFITGIVQCHCCKSKYYHWYGKICGKYYRRYKHSSTLLRKGDCAQFPKTIIFENGNEIFKIFVFSHYMLFDNSLSLMEEALFKIKAEITATQENISRISDDIIKSKKQLDKFNSIIDETDIDTIKVISKRIIEIEERIKSLSNEKFSFDIKLENLNNNYTGTKLEKVNYNIKDLINKFFTDMDDEERRVNIIKIVKTAIIFGQYILIDTGHQIYLFDLKRKYEFDYSLLKLSKEEIKHEGFYIMTLDNKNRELIKAYFERLNIDYEITADHTDIVNFTDLTVLQEERH